MNALAQKREEEEDAREQASADDDDDHAGGSKKKLFIIIGAVVLLVAVGVGVYLSGILTGDSKKEETVAETTAEESQGETAAEGEGAQNDKTAKPAVVFYELPDFLVNLNSDTSRASFLKVVVTLELADEESSLKLKELEPRIVDSFQMYLRELRPSDLKGSAGLYRLREELLLRVNKAAHPIKVNDILFKEMIVQ